MQWVSCWPHRGESLGGGSAEVSQRLWKGTLEAS